jgi:hypothetical protein
MPIVVKALQRSPEGFLQEVPLGQPLVLNTQFASVMNIDATSCDVMRIVLGADLTINVLNTGMDGQKLLLELTQDVTGGHAVTLGTGFTWGSDISVYDPSQIPGATDVIGIVRHAPSSSWRVIATAKGF